MKYSESRNRRGSNTALYVIIVLGLITIGILSWFAASRMARGNEDTPIHDPSMVTPSQNESYTSDNSSYNDSSIPAPENSSEIVGQTVSDVPYEEESQAAAPIMPLEGEIIKDYSDTSLQYSATFDDLRLHTGVDIKAPLGTAVFAAADGNVVSTDESASLGKTVTIDHGKGIMIKYCGLDNVTVSVGKSVKMGDSIGAVGSIPAECADEAHLHVEATQNGSVVSPLQIIGKIPE